MNKETLATNASKKSSALDALSKMRARRKKRISDESLSKILEDVEEFLTEGLSGKAENLLTETLEQYSHTPDNEARIYTLLSFTLETKGEYKRSLEIIDQYDNEKLLEMLDLEMQIRVINQLAMALNNTNDHPKAITLLNYSLEIAQEESLTHLYGEIYVAFSRAYRKLNEFPIARDNSRKALDAYRENGDWHGMAEAYRELAAAYNQEGNNKKAIENYQLGIKIIGERSAPFLLGKTYADMSGAYWFMRRPHDGIACLEKSIEFFSQTEHKVQTVGAYNNLGINLMLLGDWLKAEDVIQKALEIAIEVDHAHIAGILDSLAELKLLRGDLKQARELLEEAVGIAEKRKKEWYQVQAMRTLARCFLAEGKLTEAIEKARETIELCKEIGEKQYLSMTGLVLAEALLEKGDLKQSEIELQNIEDNNPEDDFFVLGNIQRIRGIAALEQDDEQLATHHFTKSLTIFETAEDLYHTALAHFMIGEAISATQPAKASKHFISASEIFRKLGVDHFYRSAEKRIEKLGTKKLDVAETSVSSQLLMQRLAEATASRELLFRELTSVLQQESKARRIVVAELNEQNKLYPFITHGYTPAESSGLIDKLNDAKAAEDLETFSKTKNVAVFQIKTSNAPPAMLLLYPRSGATLLNGSEIKPLLRVVELGMDVCALRDQSKYQQAEQEETSPYTSQSLMPGFIHSSPAMTELVEEVYKIRSSDVTVLITGESGTGKELVSRAIHTVSNRKDRVFVPFNCTAVPKELAEGHLFGYKKGAYTGAAQDSPGVIRTADGGTLFLDEIGDLPLDVQPKILRFLQEGEVQPLGEKSPMKVDVRIIAATNMNLEEQVANGQFREDLYYRLNVIRLRVPPLRERRSEIEPIINYYINHYSTRFNKRDIKIPPQTIDLLMVCNWEGNVRQLCNEVQRIVARAEDGEIITPDHLSADLKRNATPLSPIEGSNVTPIMSHRGSVGTYSIGTKGATMDEAVAELESQMIMDALRRHDGNISRVAKELGLTRRGLYLKIDRYEIDRDKAVA